MSLQTSLAVGPDVALAMYPQGITTYLVAWENVQAQWNALWNMHLIQGSQVQMNRLFHLHLILYS